MDLKITQLCRWLDQYLLIARAYLIKPTTHDIVLRFITAPPNFINFHCSTANYRTLGITEGEFYYNGPSTSTTSAQLYCMKNSIMVPVLAYEEFFAATLISINPEYVVGSLPRLKAEEVIVFDYLSKSGGQLTGPLFLPPNWRPQSTNELVPKSYVDALRLDLESRIGRLETKI